MPDIGSGLQNRYSISLRQPVSFAEVVARVQGVGVLGPTDPLGTQTAGRRTGRSLCRGPRLNGVADEVVADIHGTGVVLPQMIRRKTASGGPDPRLRARGTTMHNGFTGTCRLSP